jgi:tryptophanyl-tRNA synthetase
MTARSSGLRAVKPGEKRAQRGRPKRKPTLSEAAASDDQRALLVALRARIAKALEDPECKPPAMAALSRRLQEIGKEIAAIDRDLEADRESDGDGGASEAWDSSAI